MGAELAEMTITFLGMELDAANTIAFLLFIGAMGKSAQLFLHTWLPDAMEGPTPVSALIHAATMVTAGVFLVCRMSPIIEYAPLAGNFIVIIGALTAFFAATVGLVQNDIKRVIAYSTCSQLGYMFVAAGVGVYSVAMFHLFTHAFFKAMLFLGAGSVIHAMHHEQDMRNYGALRKKIPYTFWAMMIGTLAITGVGIPLTTIGFAGFLSKDAVIESAFAFGPGLGEFAFWSLVVAACFTSFYSWRLMFLTFFGEARGDRHTHEHAHESPMTMLVPLGGLAVGAVLSGMVWYNSFFGHTDTVGRFFGVPYAEAGEHAAEEAHGDEAVTAEGEAHGEDTAAAEGEAAPATEAADETAAAEGDETPATVAAEETAAAGDEATPAAGEAEETAAAGEEDHGEETAAAAEEDEAHGDTAMAAESAEAHGAEDGGEHHYVLTGAPGEGAIHAAPGNDVLGAAHEVPKWVKVAPFVAMLIGFATAFLFYIVDPSIPRRLAAQQRPLYNFLLNKWYFDEAYEFLFVQPARWLGRLLWKGGDGAVIDGGINGLAMGIIPFFTRQLSRAQSGYIFHYAFAMVLGIVILVTWITLSAG
jgi:NADH-quinone oxidoreductase subunit L